MYQVLKYLSNIEEEQISWGLIEAAVSSVARIAIIPMQDVLGLGSESRMNIPATQVNKETFFFIVTRASSLSRIDWSLEELGRS